MGECMVLRVPVNFPIETPEKVGSGRTMWAPAFFGVDLEGAGA